MPARNIHLVGSVPLANARDVFTTVSAALGPRLLRIPDGETGERSDWIAHLETVFADNPALEKSDEVFRLHATAPARTRYRLKPGHGGEGPELRQSVLCRHRDPLVSGFCRLKRQGKIPAHCRFQVDLVPAHSVIWLFLQDDLHRAVDPIYNEAVRREIDKLAARHPARSACDPVRRRLRGVRPLQRNEPDAYGRDKREMIETFGTILIGLAEHVPADVELLFHFCYGDSNHRHVVEPVDMGDMVALANHLSRGLARSIQLIHMPVPRDRADDAYFEPLSRLALAAGNGALPRPRALHRRDRRHASAPRGGRKICEELLDRDRMRVRPPAGRYYTDAAANSRRGG